MADTKLSALTELAVEPADTDEIYVNDGGTSKRVQYTTVKAALVARSNHTGTQTASTISDFDTEVSNNSDVAANTAKVTNATHSGDAVGDTALTLQPAAITGKGAVTVAAGDLLLVADVSASPQVLGQVTASSVADLATPEGTAILSTGEVGGTKFLREDGDGTCSWQTVPAGTGDLKADGTVPLTADWDVGAFQITALRFHSDEATLSPFTVASSAVVTNLNADLLDGNEASAFAAAAHNHDSDYISIVGTPTAGNFPQLTAGGELVNSTYDETSFATAAQANATHSGDAVGDTALTLQPAAITGKGAVTVAAGDLLLVTDVSASPQVLGQVTAQSIADLAAPQGTSIRSDGTSPVAIDGYVLTADGAGGAAWEAGGGAVDWSTTQTSNLSAATGDEVAFDLSSTVNKATSGNYTGLKLNVTETAAPGTADKLLDLQVGNTSRFYVNNANELVVGPPSGNTSFYIRHQQDTDQYIRIAPDGGGYFTATNNAGADHARLQNGVYVASGSSFGFSNSATNANPALADIFLARDAAANLALRNSTTAQTFRVYNTYTDASNYQRLSLGWNTSTALIHNEGAGTGADGSVAFNDAALATTATKGFLMIPSCAGAPTGTPADIPTGQVPIVFDSTNNQLYVYDGGWLATAALT